jgi:hypothetical protein
MNAVKHFTPQEATRTLPLVRRIVEDILALANTMRMDLSTGEGTIPAEKLDSMREQMKVLFDELEELGCSYRDWSFDKGLVDFPAVIDGQEVLLCWRSDEPEVAYYHDYTSGFAGRKPIPQESLDE